MIKCKAGIADLAIFGGSATFDPPKPIGCLANPDPEKILRYSKIFYDRRWYTNNGPVNQMLEARLAEWHGTARCVSFANAFWGISLAIRQLALPGRHEVVTPSLTYRRIGEIVASAGLIPRFCDADPATLAQSVEATRACITDDTALILGVHPTVNCCDAQGLERLSAETGVPLLFDSVESVFETCHGRRVGTFGRAEVFSLHSTTLVNGFEGGYVTTDDDELADALKLARAFGIPGEDRVASFGMNAKLNEIHAATAMANLDDLPALVERNKERYRAYRELLDDVDGLCLCRFDESEQTSFNAVLVQVGNDWPLSRDDTVAVLRAEGALARPYCSPALHMHKPWFETRFGALPVAERISQEYLLLPCGDQVSLGDIAEVVELLRFVCQHGHEIDAGLAACKTNGGGAPYQGRPDSAAERPGRERVVKRVPADFACAGGTPAFPAAIPVGQLYFPDWDRYQAAIRGIVQRCRYTSDGPLVRELERRLEVYLGVRNVVVVPNGTLGLYLVTLALGLKGKVIVPSFAFIATAQAFLLAGIEPVFCDVDPYTHHMTPETAEAALKQEQDGVSAVCAVNLWGGSADIPGLQSWARSHQLPLLFDSAHAFGVRCAEGMVGRFGRAEVFSFHATKVMSATEGGCVCTDDDDLAERVRAMRSDTGLQRLAAFPYTENFRLSEAQAAIGLMSLDDLERRIAHNHNIFQTYQSILAVVPGVRMLEPVAEPNGPTGPNSVVRSNYQSAVLEITESEYGLSRDTLWTILRAEGIWARRYFSPGTHRCVPFDSMRPQQIDALPITDGLCQTVLQLPVGAMVTLPDAATIAGIIRDVRVHAEALR